MTASSTILPAVPLHRPLPHRAYIWVSLLVALLPYTGYFIFPPVSRLVSFPYSSNQFYWDFYLDIARSIPFLIGILLAPANFIAAAFLIYLFHPRRVPQILCFIAFLLSVPTTIWYIWSITH